MGAAWSSYRLKREEKALYKKMLRNKLREAKQYVKQLLEQRRSFDELLWQQQSSFPNPAHVAQRKQAETNAAALEDEMRALKEKLHLEEIAVAVTSERCRKLEKNLSLLQQNEHSLQEQTPLGQKTLTELIRLKTEACPFAQYNKSRPIESWTLPQFHISQL